MESLIEQIFTQVLLNSLAGSLLISFLLPVVWLLRKNVSAVVSTVLAAGILIRLALPVVPEIGFSFSSWIPGISSEQREAALEETPVVLSQRILSPVPVSESAPLPPVGVAVVLDPAPVLSEEVSLPASKSVPLLTFALVWLGGVLGIFGIIGVQHLRLARKVAGAKEGEKIDELESILSSSSKQLGLRRRVSICFPGEISSPMLFGIWKPKLLLPDTFGEDFTKEEIRAIFLHELAHLRRRDLWWNWFACGVLCLHWFNPLVWILVRRFRFDREKLCDRLANSLLPESNLYSSTLLKAVRLLAAPDRTPVTLHPGTSSIFSRKSEIKQRLLMIQNPPRTSTVSKLLLSSSFSLALFLSLPAGGEDRDQDREKPSRDRAAEADRGHPERDARRDGERETPESRKQRGDREKSAPGRRGDLEREHPEREHPEREHPERERARDREEGASPGRGDRPVARHHSEDERERMDHHLREMRNALTNTLRAGRHEEAEAIERRILEMEEHRERMDLPRESPRPEAEVRLHHLHMAAENLERAGLHDEAERYRDQARHLEENLRRDRHSREHPDRADQLEREVHQLREMVGDLQHQIRELHEQLRRERVR